VAICGSAPCARSLRGHGPLPRRFGCVLSPGATRPIARWVTRRAGSVVIGKPWFGATAPTLRSRACGDLMGARHARDRFAGMARSHAGFVFLAQVQRTLSPGGLRGAPGAWLSERHGLAPLHPPYGAGQSGDPVGAGLGCIRNPAHLRGTATRFRTPATTPT